MLFEFSVKNFKSIKDQATISFEATTDDTDEDSHIIKMGKYRILKLGALFGANASGKTNIIQAFDFLRSFIVYSATRIKPNDNTGFIPFLFNKINKKNPGVFRIIFFIDKRKYEYEINLDANIIYSEKLYFSPKGQKTRLYEREFDKQENGYSYKWGSAIKIDEALISKARKNIPLLSSIVQLVEHEELKKVYDWFDNTVKPIITPGINLYRFTIDLLEKKPDSKGLMLSILSSADLGSIDNIEIKSIKTKINSDLVKILRKDFIENLKDNEIKQVFLHHKFKAGEGSISIVEESSGTQRFFDLIGPLYYLLNEKSFLQIDELESSLHPALQEQLITIFLRNKCDSQLLFTTHNVELLDSGLLRRDEIWFSEKNIETGGSEYFSLADIKGIRKMGSYRKQYLAGKYGAIPVINNIEE